MKQDKIYTLGMNEVEANYLEKNLTAFIALQEAQLKRFQNTPEDSPIEQQDKMLLRKLPKIIRAEQDMLTSLAVSRDQENTHEIKSNRAGMKLLLEFLEYKAKSINTTIAEYEKTPDSHARFKTEPKKNYVGRLQAAKLLTEGLVKVIRDNL